MNRFYYILDTIKGSGIRLAKKTKYTKKLFKNICKDTSTTKILSTRKELKEFLKICPKGITFWTDDDEKEEAIWIKKHFGVPYFDD